LVSLTGASLNGPDVVLDITPMFAATVNGARDIAFGFTVTESVLGILFAVMRWRSNRTQPVIQLAGTPAKTMVSSIHSKPALRVRDGGGTAAVPERMSIALIGAGLLGLGLLRRRSSKRL
jgi:hypothetical protein